MQIAKNHLLMQAYLSMPNYSAIKQLLIIIFYLLFTSDILYFLAVGLFYWPINILNICVILKVLMVRCQLEINLLLKIKSYFCVIFWFSIFFLAHQVSKNIFFGNESFFGILEIVMRWYNTASQDLNLRLH